MAIGYYRQAADIPLTSGEIARMERMRPTVFPEKLLRAGFTADAMEAIGNCFLQLGRNAEAQKWMVKADDVREKNHVGRNAFFAGMTQAASGERTIEGRIRREERKSRSNPDYWMERAAYYRGRQDTTQEESALRKALDLTKPQPKPDRPTHWADPRSWALTGYVEFLARNHRTDEAIALLRSEIDQFPTSVSAERAVQEWTSFKKELRPDDEVLWAWLARRPKWDIYEKDILWNMLENANPDQFDQCIVRAQSLAMSGDSSRACKLGWILDQAKWPQQAIPLFQHAMAKTADKDLKESALFDLFIAYLDSGDWRHAEEVFPEAAKRIGAVEIAEFYSRIAVVAAKGRQRSEALRIWKAAANINPSDLHNLDQLARTGLGVALTAYYHEMQRRLPSSNVPAAALRALTDRNESGTWVPWSAINRATVTDTNVASAESLCIDKGLLEAAGMPNGPSMDVLDLTNGAQLHLSVEAAPSGSGIVRVNGAAARQIHMGDCLFLSSYWPWHNSRTPTGKATVVLVDEKNRVKRVSHCAPSDVLK